MNTISAIINRLCEAPPASAVPNARKTRKSVNALMAKITPPPMRTVSSAC